MKIFITLFVSLVLLDLVSNIEDPDSVREITQNEHLNAIHNFPLEASKSKNSSTAKNTSEVSTQDTTLVGVARHLQDKLSQSSSKRKANHYRKLRKTKHFLGKSKRKASKNRKLARVNHKKFERGLVKLYKDLEKHLRTRKLIPAQGVLQQADGLKDNHIIVNTLGMPANVTSAGDPEDWKKGYDENDLEPKIVVERLRLPSYSESVRRAKKKYSV